MQPPLMKTVGRGGVTVNADAGCPCMNKEDIAKEVYVPVQ